MTHNTRQTGRGVGRRGGRVVTALAVALPPAVLFSACSDLLDVDAPSRIVAETLEQPSNAAALVAGAVGDFECALAHYIVAQGVTTQELQQAGGSAAWRAYDARQNELSGFFAPHAEGTCSNPHQGSVPGVYKPLSTARWQADNILGLLEGWTDEQVPGRVALQAKAAVYAGYSYLLLGEGMCSAAFDLGPELQPPEIFALAETRFTAALNFATQAGDNAILNLVRVGRARTRLNLARPADAKTDAEAVPAGFVRNAGYSSISARRENRVFVSNNRSENVTVGASFRTVGDPRIALSDRNRLSAAGIPLWHQLKYATATTAIPLATWEEAQLIVAEAELAAGNLQAAVDAINRVRTRSGVGLAPFSSSDPAAIRAQILFERKVELWLESHSLGDLRRYDLPLTPPAGTPHPFGGLYADQECFPLPLVERVNNPNIGAP